MKTFKFRLLFFAGQLILPAFILLFNVNIFAQGMDTATNYPQNEETLLTDPVYTKVEEMPSFPGGDDAMFKYISENIKYPKEAKEKRIEGKSYITFVVNKEGKIVEPKIMRGIGGGCDEEALRVVKSMPPWKAGMQNGKPANVQMMLPVHFKL